MRAGGRECARDDNQTTRQATCSSSSDRMPAWARTANEDNQILRFDSRFGHVLQPEEQVLADESIFKH